VLDDLIERGLRRPQFLIVDGASGLDRAIAAVWDNVPLTLIQQFGTLRPPRRHAADRGRT